MRPSKTTALNVSLTLVAAAILAACGSDNDTASPSVTINGVVTAELHDHDPRKRTKGVLAMPVIPAEMKVQYKDLQLARIRN